MPVENSLIHIVRFDLFEEVLRFDCGRNLRTLEVVKRGRGRCRQCGWHLGTRWRLLVGGASVAVVTAVAGVLMLLLMAGRRVAAVAHLPPLQRRSAKLGRGRCQNELLALGSIEVLVSLFGGPTGRNRHGGVLFGRICWDHGSRRARIGRNRKVSSAGRFRRFLFDVYERGLLWLEVLLVGLWCGCGDEKVRYFSLYQVLYWLECRGCCCT